MFEIEALPKDTYDMDETGFIMGNAQSGRVLDIIQHSRDGKGMLFPADMVEILLPKAGKGQRIGDGSREFATAICCVCADGTYLDSAVIYKSADMQEQWFEEKG